MNRILNSLFTVVLFLVCTATGAAEIKTTTGQLSGTIFDLEYNEPLLGATVQIEGTTRGTVTDIDGKYVLDNIQPGTYTILVSYISFEPKRFSDIAIKAGATTTLDVEMSKANLQIEEVVVTAKRNLESENVLLQQRQLSNLAVESIGASEMSIKGVSNAEDGVKKLTGISIGESSQVIVRGLGDRYSATTLNSMPIASPNPDNKLIPLTLFPSAVVKNITVSKVYDPKHFADYSGAMIDVETKENMGKRYLSVSATVGGVINTLLKSFYSPDLEGGIPYLGYAGGGKLSQHVKDMNWNDFQNLKADLFRTTFDIHKKRALPNIGLTAVWGGIYNIGNNTLDVLAAGNFKNSYQIKEHVLSSTLTAQGVKLDEFEADQYLYETTTSLTGQVGYTFAQNQKLYYKLLYAHNTEDMYSRRSGFDAEGVELEGSNSVYHAYSLLNNQVGGIHPLSNLWALNWNASYSNTDSSEPDRRQVMYQRTPEGYKIFRLNQQETMRFFGNLNENETTASARATYFIGKQSNKENTLNFGAAYRNKSRDFSSHKDDYAYKNAFANDLIITDIYTPNFINASNIASGNISIVNGTLPKDAYKASMQIAAAYADLAWNFNPQWLLNVGLRGEYAKQNVDYFNDAGTAKQSEIKGFDLFPAVNVKYSSSARNAWRMAASRTITRPSFIEMAPFDYKESYGSATIRGYADLQNAYNYNFDLRYELFPATGELISIGGYYKFLDKPIERVQEYSGSAIQTFRNVQQGQVAGVEAEWRKNLTRDWKAGINASYIYTFIKLPQDGVYTDSKRQLQGASPYLINADVSYNPQWGKNNSASLALVYNLRGPRIYAVGINGIGNVNEKEVHTLDFIGSWQLNTKAKLTFQAKNIINQSRILEQEIADTGKKETVGRSKDGVKLEIGFSYTFY